MASVLLAALALPLLASACAKTGTPVGKLPVIEVQVPDEVARRALLRARGDLSAATPVLRLEGVEMGADERLTIDLVDAEAGGSAPSLGRAATVGNGDGSYGPPIVTATLVFPLNELACQLIAGKERVRLALRVDAPDDRPQLKFLRATFADGGD